MLQGLISSSMNNYSNTAFVKAFVGKILWDLSLRETVKRVLEKVFRMSLNTVNESLEDYSSPMFRGDQNETETIQRLNLHKASTNRKHLLWLVERMIELRVVDVAVREWSEQRAFCDDAWRNIVSGLPVVILRCTFRLANAVSVGTILASRQGVKRISNVLSGAGKELERIVLDHLQIAEIMEDNRNPCEIIYGDGTREIMQASGSCEEVHERQLAQVHVAHDLKNKGFSGSTLSPSRPQFAAPLLTHHVTAHLGFPSWMRIFVQILLQMLVKLRSHDHGSFILLLVRPLCDNLPTPCFKKSRGLLARVTDSDAAGQAIFESSHLQLDVLAHAKGFVEDVDKFIEAMDWISGGGFLCREEAELGEGWVEKDGLCPLTPEETALTLKALDIDQNIQNYTTAGKIYSGERRMASLAKEYPKLVNINTQGKFVCNMFRSFELLARATVQVKLYSLVSALTHSILPAFLPMSAMVVSLAPFVVPIGPTACDLGNDDIILRGYSGSKKTRLMIARAFQRRLALYFLVLLLSMRHKFMEPVGDLNFAIAGNKNVQRLHVAVNEAGD
ncbi:hypothetical protein JHK87_006932 [Glycine soja]|nr:hypothetical protein JHK87_006932 [Glycine soja]